MTIVSSQATLSNTDIESQHSASIPIPKSNTKHMEIKSSPNLLSFNNNNMSYFSNSYQLLSNSPKAKNRLNTTLNSFQHSPISGHLKKTSVVKIMDSKAIQSLKWNESINNNTNTTNTSTTTTTSTTNAPTHMVANKNNITMSTLSTNNVNFNNINNTTMNPDNTTSTNNIILSPSMHCYSTISNNNDFVSTSPSVKAASAIAHENVSFNKKPIVIRNNNDEENKNTTAKLWNTNDKSQLIFELTSSNDKTIHDSNNTNINTNTNTNTNKIDHENIQMEKNKSNRTMNMTMPMNRNRTITIVNRNSENESLSQKTTMDTQTTTTTTTSTSLLSQSLPKEEKVNEKKETGLREKEGTYDNFISEEKKKTINNPSSLLKKDTKNTNQEEKKLQRVDSKIDLNEDIKIKVETPVVVSPAVTTMVKPIKTTEASAIKTSSAQVNSPKVIVKKKNVKFSDENEECPFRRFEAPTLVKSSPIFLVNALIKPFLESRVNLTSFSEFKQGMIIRKPIVIEKAGLLVEEKEKNINSSLLCFKPSEIKKEHGVFKARPSHVPYGPSTTAAAAASSSLHSTMEKDKVRIVIQVQNLAFHKEVYVRYTFNNWLTTKDIPAKYYNSLTVTSYINKRYHESTSISTVQSNEDKVKTGIDDHESKVVVKSVDRFVADIEVPSYIIDFMEYEGMFPDNSCTSHSDIFGDDCKGNLAMNFNIGRGGRKDDKFYRRRYSQSLGEEWDNDIINKCNIKFAVYYRVNGEEYWENNNNLNYALDLQRVLYIPTKQVYTRSHGNSAELTKIEQQSPSLNKDKNLTSILKKNTNKPIEDDKISSSFNKITNENKNKYILESIRKDLLNSSIFQRKGVDPTVLNTILNTNKIGNKGNIMMMMKYYQKKACISIDNDSNSNENRSKRVVNSNNNNRIYRKNVTMQQQQQQPSSKMNNNYSTRRNNFIESSSNVKSSIGKDNNNKINSLLSNQGIYKYESKALNNPLGISIQ